MNSTTDSTLQNDTTLNPQDTSSPEPPSKEKKDHMPDPLEYAISAFGPSSRLPNFYRANPNLWFMQLDNVFSTSRIVSPKLKFQLATGVLEYDVLTQIADILCSDSADPYKELKDRLTSLYGVSDNRRIHKLLEDTQLGSQRPSQLYRQMLQLAGDTLSADMVRALWLRNLPVRVQEILTGLKQEKIEKLIEMADQIMELTRPSEVYDLHRQAPTQPPHQFLTSQPAEIYSFNRPAQPRPSTSARDEATFLLTEEVKKLREEVAVLRLQIRSRSQDRQSPGPRQRSRSASKGPILEKEAVRGSEAVLPCDTKPPIANDTVVLVVWYKDDVKPIFSIDSRASRSLETGIKWSDPAVLEERASFRTATEPPQLVISRVEERDQALYRCRVDFKVSPTRNFKINLTVIVPPQRPQIFDESGRELTSFAGPYEEGSEMKLTCVVSGGRPEPWLRWWRDETLVDSQDTNAGYPNVKKNQLVVSRLTREHLNSLFTCQASNNNLSQPVSTSLHVEIHFKPMNVSIVTEVQPMSANRKYEIICVSVGSRPPAKITWWRENDLLKTVTEIVSDDKNVTSSTLTFAPTTEDNGRRLICRADNPSLSGAAQEVTWKLDVHYMPDVRLELGSQMNPEDIEEGDDVYFECKVKANPSAYKVVWKHNNQIIQGSQKTGVHVSHKALVLQNVRRSQTGNYTCVASNVEGDGESNTVQLKVMYKPLCRSDQKHVFGVARNEDARVMCEVDSFPTPDEFFWSFNNSAETNEIPSTKFLNSLSLSLSTLSYTPQTEMDYGTVMCWAKNTVGQQREPCVFHIIAAGRPDAPYNCTLINQTLNSLEVECLEGFDGGQTQSFQLEAYNEDTHYLFLNKTSRTVNFKIEGLAPGVNVKLVMYSFNSKGRSDPVDLEGFTLKLAEKQTGNPVPFYITPMVVVLGVATLVLMSCILVIFGVLKARNRTEDKPDGNLNRANEKTKVPLRIDAREMYDMDDNNPDLIPSNKDSDYQLVSNAGVHSASLKLTQDRSPSLSESFNGNLKDSSGIPNVDMYENFKNVQHQSKNKGEECFYEDQCTIRLNGGENMPSLLKRDLTSSLFSENELNRCNLSPSGGILAHREVITVRTPLMANQQESCV